MAQSTITRRVSSGTNIKETIESFTVANGETIPAGTFVDYIEKNLIFSDNSVYDEFYNYNTEIAVLEPNKIVIAFSNSNSNDAFLRVGIINNTTITWGNKVFFYSGSSNLFNNISLIALESTKVLIAFSSANTDGLMRIGTVTGDSIVLTGTFIFNSGRTSIPKLSLLDSNKVILCYNDIANSKYATARIVTINGTIITFGSEYVFYTSGIFRGVTRVDNNKVIVVIGKDLGGAVTIIGTINGNAINFGSELLFNNLSYEPFSIVYLKNNKVALIDMDGGEYSFPRPPLNGRIGNIIGTNIYWGEKYLIDDDYAPLIYATAIKDNKILVAYTDMNAPQYTYIGKTIVGDIIENTISWGDQIVFSRTMYSEVRSVAALDTNRVIISYTINNFPSSSVPVIGQLTKEIINTDSIEVFGLAKTGGTEGETIEVYTNS